MDSNIPANPAYGVYISQLVRCARIITGKRKFDHITPVLRELRWLPVTSSLKYTLGVLAFKCVKGLVPPTFVIDLRHVLAFMTVILDIRIT